MDQWPHAPIHILREPGAYIVTSGTYLKSHHLRTAPRLGLVQTSLFEVAQEYGWGLQAWAVLSNHYHFVATSPEQPESLAKMISKLHSVTATELNRMDGTPGRRVWYQYFDSHITYQRSYLARLKYVHQHGVHHRLVGDAENYPWCSASWFARKAKPSFCRTVAGFKIDRVNVMDPFEPIAPQPERESGVKPPHSESISTAS